MQRKKIICEANQSGEEISFKPVSGGLIYTYVFIFL